MEHKLITGGEQYLPFARSRIKAMRATGLMFASQQFEIDGCSIKVRIEGDHEFITLSGGFEILSGVTKGGHVINLPIPPGGTTHPKTMRSYKPTQNAWDTVLHNDPAKSPSTFNDEKKLKNAGEQYAELAASQYSGLMTKAVQVVMGQGKEVKYKFKWLTCHGIVLAADGKPWLVEISKANGVIAMPLPLAARGDFTHDPRDAVKECGTVFGGVPSGKSFPKSGDLTAAINAGNVIRLASVDYMATYFANHAFHDDLGWSFNADGTEAHNTCYSGVPAQQTPVTSYHYKLAITIGAMDPNRAANAPRATGLAVLSIVESGRLVTHQYYAPTIPFLFAGGVVPAEDQLTSPDYSGGDAPLFVCHINGVLEVVRVAVVPQSSLVSTVTGDPAGHYAFTVRHENNAGGRMCYAPRAATGVSDDVEMTEVDILRADSAAVLTTFPTYDQITHLYGTHTDNGVITGLLRSATTYTLHNRGVLLWTGTIRDSYAFTSALPAAATLIGYDYIYSSDADPTAWSSGSWVPPPGSPSGSYLSEIGGTVSGTFSTPLGPGFQIDVNWVNTFYPQGHGVRAVGMDCYLPDGSAINIPDVAPYVTGGVGWEVIAAVIRTNCFGPNPQATFATSLKSLNQGSVLAGVPDPTPDLINFIGYI